MTRTKKFFLNSFTTGIYQIIVMLVGFITPKILLQFYGSELNGMVSSISQFISYFSLIEAGLAGATVYSLYKPLAEHNKDEISSVVSTSKSFYIKSGILFTLFVLCLAIIYPIFIKTDSLSTLMVGLLVVVLGAKGFMDFFTLAKYRALLTADQKTYVISIASSIYLILQAIIIVVFCYLRFNIVLVYALSVLSLFARSIILILYVKKHYPYINYKAPINKKALDKRWDALFLQILQFVQTGAPIIIITIFTTLTQVSIYSIFNMVLTGINGILGIFSTGLSATFGELLVCNKNKQLKKAYQDFEFIYYIIIAIVYAISFLLINSFVQIYTRNVVDANYNQPLIGFLFVLNGLLYNIKTPQGMMVISAGLYKETRWRTVTQALIIIIGGLILTPFFGLVGVLIASCLSNFYRDIDLLFYNNKYMVKDVIKDSLRNVFCLAIIIISILVFGNIIFIEGTSVVTWILNGIIFAVFGVIVSLIISFLFNRERLKSVWSRIRFMVVKKNGTI